MNPEDATPQQQRPGGIEKPGVHLTAMILAGAIAGSVLMLGCALAFINAGSLDREPRDLPELRAMFYALALASQLVLPLVYRLLKPRPSDGNATAGRREEIERGWLQRHIVGLAFAETPAILGFVLAVLRGDTTDFFILASCSLALLAMHWPSRRALDRELLAEGIVASE